MSDQDLELAFINADDEGKDEAARALIAWYESGEAIVYRLRRVLEEGGLSEVEIQLIFDAPEIAQIIRRGDSPA